LSRELRYSVTEVAFDEEGENAQGTHDVYAANHLWPRDKLERQRAVMCDICGDELRESQVRLFRGKSYGVPCGCVDEIRGILLRERAEIPPVRRGIERESRILTE
jgi:hypothetical protein